MSAVSTRKSVEAREKRMGGCGVAAMLDLDGGDGCGSARPSGGAQTKLERGRDRGRGVEFQ